MHKSSNKFVSRGLHSDKNPGVVSSVYGKNIDNGKPKNKNIRKSIYGRIPQSVSLLSLCFNICSVDPSCQSPGFRVNYGNR